MPKRWHGLTILAAVLVVVIACLMMAVLLAFGAVPYFAAPRVEKQVQQTLDKIAASGAPVKLAQLAKPPIPDSQNAAIVYRQAFAALHLSDKDRVLFLTPMRRGKSDLSDPAVSARVKDLLARNRKALELIHRASAMPRCDFKLDWSKGFHLTFPQYSELRNCSRLLALQSLLLLHQGRVDEALEVCRANLRVTNAADDPTLNGQSLQYEIIGVACKSLGAVLRESHPSAARCSSLVHEIADTDLVAGYVGALEGQRATVIALFEKLRVSRNPAKDTGHLLRQPTTSDKPASRRRVKLAPFWRWMIASDELTYLQLMERTIRQASLPYRRAVRIHPSVEESAKHLPKMPPRLFTAMLVPAYTHIHLTRDRAIASLGLAEIALLLKAYRAGHGRYPVSLPQLAAANDRPLPTDPFSGKPFVYRREGQGFLIYSCGPNLKDDHGTQPPPDKRDEGDIVMRCAR